MNANVFGIETIMLVNRAQHKALAVSLLAAVPLAAGQEISDYARIFRDGCSVNLINGKAWRAYVWADYEEGADKHDFAVRFSERSNRWKAIKDCDEWLTATDKKVAEVTNAKTAAQHERATQVAERQ
jgi:hypothetical protein